MIDERSLQRALKAKGLYSGPIDGIIGAGSRAGMRTAVVRATALPAAAKWLDARIRLAFEQIMFRDLGFYAGPIDGLDGPNTRYALEQWQDHLRDVDDDEPAPAGRDNDVPAQSDAVAYYGKPGANHVPLALPFPMRLAWDLGSTIRSFPINRRAADSALRALTKIHTSYGEQRIRELRLDRWAGCYAPRPMRGSKTRLSMHAFACAIDVDSEFNQFRWGRDRASLSQPVYEPFWRAWEEEGWVSLGRARNYDWMHVQRARL